MIKLLIITLLLLFLELVYFKVADRFNIIDKPNERSSHKTLTLRGGGVIFLLGAWLYAAFYGFQYPWFLAGLTLVAGVSFVDDIRSLPDSVRLVVQFLAAALAFYQLDILHPDMWWMVILALVVYVGITNVYNFMDGINGITAGYSLAVLVPMMVVNGCPIRSGMTERTVGMTEGVLGMTERTVGMTEGVLGMTERVVGMTEGVVGMTGGRFVDPALIVVTVLSVLVFCIFNFRPKGKAKCFAGDVGSIGIAFIILFILGNIIFKTGDITYLMLLVVYGIDACLTIVHRILLHENLGEAHRKHAYQLMANELKVGHVKVTSLYMAVQLVISLVFIYVIPDTVLAHWIYLIAVVLVLSAAYVLFMKKYYHLHEEYLKSIGK